MSHIMIITAKLFKTIVTLILFSSLASADILNGNSLLTNLDADLDEENPLKDWKKYTGHTMAVGYTLGVFDAHEGMFYTNPGGVGNTQKIDIAIKHLKEHPEERHKGAVELLIKAFQEAFPLDQK